MTTKVHSITGTKVFSQFLHSLAYRVAVTKISCLQAFEAHTNLGLRLFVAQGMKPFGKWFFTFFGLISKDFNHGNNVACKLPHGKSFD